MKLTWLETVAAVGAGVVGVTVAYIAVTKKEPAPTVVVASATAIDATKIPSCHDNLCGGDSYCSCHDVGAYRCWTSQEDCDIDRVCCAADGGCVGMSEDKCSAAVRADVAKRVGKKP